MSSLLVLSVGVPAAHHAPGSGIIILGSVTVVSKEQAHTAGDAGDSALRAATLDTRWRIALGDTEGTAIGTGTAIDGNARTR